MTGIVGRKPLNSIYGDKPVGQFIVRQTSFWLATNCFITSTSAVGGFPAVGNWRTRKGRKTCRSKKRL